MSTENRKNSAFSAIHAAQVATSLGSQSMISQVVKPLPSSVTDLLNNQSDILATMCNLQKTHASLSSSHDVFPAVSTTSQYVENIRDAAFSITGFQNSLSHSHSVQASLSALAASPTAKILNDMRDAINPLASFQKSLFHTRLAGSSIAALAASPTVKILDDMRDAIDPLAPFQKSLFHTRLAGSSIAALVASPTAKILDDIMGAVAAFSVIPNQRTEPHTKNHEQRKKESSIIVPPSASLTEESPTQQIIHPNQAILPISIDRNILAFINNAYCRVVQLCKEGYFDDAILYWTTTSNLIYNFIPPEIKAFLDCITYLIVTFCLYQKHIRE